MSNLQKKKAIVEDLVSKLTNSHFYITDSQGLNVQQINEIRKTCFEKGIRYQVVKNTLLKKALHIMNDQEIIATLSQNKVLKEFSGVFIAQQTPSEPAKIIKNFQTDKKSTKPLLKSAVVNGELYIGPKSLEALSKLKSKEVLLGELVSLLQSPAKRLIASLKGPQNKLSSVIKAIPSLE